MIFRFFVLLIVLCFTNACGSKQKDRQSPSLTPVADSTKGGVREGPPSFKKSPVQMQSDTTIEQDQQANFMVKTFSSEEGWGYDILIDGKIKVHQPFIPAVQGRKGFDTQEKAKKAAALMIQKLEQKIMPPRLTIEELDSLGAL